MKKKKQLIIGFIVILAIVLFICFKKWEERENVDYTQLTERWYTESKPDGVKIKWLNNDQWLLVTTNEKEPVYSYKGNKQFVKGQTQPVVGLKNLLLTNTEYVTPKNDGTIESKTMKCEIELYSIEQSSLKKQKVIDLNKRMKEYNPDYSVRQITKFTSDEKYIIVYNWDIDKDEPFYFRLSDEKFFSQSELDPKILQEIQNDKENVKYAEIRSTNFQIRKIINSTGLFYNESLNGLTIRNRTEPHKVSMLEEEYPEIGKIFSKNLIGYLNFSKAPPAPEELAVLMVPKGTDPWEGVSISDNASSDGQEHEINSVDEYNALEKQEE